MNRALRVMLWTVCAVTVVVAVGLVGLAVSPKKAMKLDQSAPMPPPGMMAKLGQPGMMGPAMMGGLGGMPGSAGMPGGMGAPAAGVAPGAELAMKRDGYAAESRMDAAAAPPGGPLPSGPFPPGAAVAATDRKLVRTAEVSLETRETEKIINRLDALAYEMGGFVGSSSLTRTPAGGQQGSVTLRVPVGRFDQALSEVRKLGKVMSLNSGVQDVTGQVVDLEARITNSKREEAEIAKLFQRSGKLSDIITVEEKLSEVRERIEQFEGQLRSMREQTDLSTITVTVFEPGEAVVPEPPQYSAEYHVANALRALIALGQGLLTVLIYVLLVGWIVWVPILIGCWLYSARRRREAAARPNEDNTPGPPQT